MVSLASFSVGTNPDGDRRLIALIFIPVKLTSISGFVKVCGLSKKQSDAESGVVCINVVCDQWLLTFQKQAIHSLLHSRKIRHSLRRLNPPFEDLMHEYPASVK